MTVDKRLPPMKSLVAFRAAARQLSISLAAEELSLTPSAVSKQVQHLEELLGQDLFRRLTRGLELTALGEQFLRELEPLLDGLGTLTRSAGGAVAPSGLHLLVPPAFAAGWLLPRLAALAARRPELEVQVSTFKGVGFEDVVTPELRRQNADAAVLFGAGDWGDGWAAIPLVKQAYLVPMAAPSLLSEPAERVEELASLPWLYNSSHPDGWPHWLRCAGFPDLTPARRLTFSDGQALYDAARRGLGVAMCMGSPTDPLHTRGLSLAHSFHVPLGRHTYYLTYPPEHRNHPALVILRDWLEEA